MKKISFAIILLTSIGFSANAQQADLQAYVNFTQYQCLDAGQEIQPDTAVKNQPYGVWGVVNRGPDEIDSNEVNWISTPYNLFNIKDSLNPNGNGLLYFSSFKTKYAPVNYYVTLLSYLKVDSIHTLLDIDAYQRDTTGLYINFMVKRENLKDGDVYGFFLINRGVGDVFLSPDNLDSNKANDMAFVPITWHCNKGSNTGIAEMMEEAALKVLVYPNPVQNTLNFRYGFLKTTEKATAQIIDMTGRIVATKELGKQNFGTPNFKMDVSDLANGNYILQMVTDYITATGKFTISK